MSNYTGEPAFYVEPQMTVEVIQNLKEDIARYIPEEQRASILASFGIITERDLMLYVTGKGAALKEITALKKHFGKAGQSNGI